MDDAEIVGVRDGAAVGSERARQEAEERALAAAVGAEAPEPDAGPIPKIPLNLVLLKGAQIVGVFWGSFTAREPARHQANIRELVHWYTAGKLKLWRTAVQA